MYRSRSVSLTVGGCRSSLYVSALPLPWSQDRSKVSFPPKNSAHSSFNLFFSCSLSFPNSDWATNNLEWYDPRAVTTVNGSLVITLSKADDPAKNHDLDFIVRLCLSSVH
jgi:beta-glucanase (GH16 family)